MSVIEAADSICSADQKLTFILCKRKNVSILRGGEELRCTWLPAPETMFHSDPEIPFCVFIKTERPNSERSIFAAALHAPDVNGTESPRVRRPRSCNPYSALLILKQSRDI